MKYLSVCSGVEAATCAWHSLGWEPFAFSEIEKFPSQVLAHHYPSVPNLGDMTKFEEWPYAAIDILVGGTPCQSFSVAGLRKGLADPRGNLMLTFGAIARRYSPRWLVWENVPGVLSSNGGRDFGTFLGMLGQLGYGFAYRVLDAQYFGVAQRRRRVFVVGHLGDWRRAAAVLFERHSLQGNPAPSREAGEGAAAGTLRCTDGGSDVDHARAVHLPITMAHGQGGSEIGFDRGPTLTCNHEAPIAAYAIQAGALRTNPASGPDGVGVQEGHAYTLEARAEVQAVCVTGQVTHTLKAEGFDASEDGTGRGQPIVAHQNPAVDAGNVEEISAVAFAQNSRDEVRLMNGDGQIVGALAAEPGVKQTCYVAQSVSLRGREGGATAEPSDVCHTLSAAAGQGDSSPHVATAMQVRRLTPRECERLQGFPDDYTLITGHKADGPRYKALGNSMAVPVMEWIGRRIKAVDAICDDESMEAA